jgi:DNA-binding response OmpR family regulator
MVSPEDPAKGEHMGLTSPFDTVSAEETPVLSRSFPGTNMRESFPKGSWRFGGLIMDARTGVTHWRGRALELSLEERELLGVLLHHAGQIISTERIARQLGKEIQLMDAQISALSARLQQEGVTCLPRRADGLGYVLWHS